MYSLFLTEKTLKNIAELTKALLHLSEGEVQYIDFASEDELKRTVYQLRNWLFSNNLSPFFNIKKTDLPTKISVSRRFRKPFAIRRAPGENKIRLQVIDLLFDDLTEDFIQDEKRVNKILSTTEFTEEERKELKLEWVKILSEKPVFSENSEKKDFSEKNPFSFLTNPSRKGE